MALPYEHPERMLTVSEGLTLDFSVINYARYIKEVRTLFYLFSYTD
jgi:hypothetical protein